MFNAMNLDFIQKTTIPPNTMLEGLKITKTNEKSLILRNWNCNCYDDYDCDCDCDCDCNYDCDCDDCYDPNPYDLDPWDYEMWRDSLDK